MAKTKKKATESTPNGSTNGSFKPKPSLAVAKTYKLYIGGKFPRTESGRVFKLHAADGGLVANICQASRKDFRNAVVAARKAFSGWAGRTAYNRSQILYRMAEMLEGRSAQFVEELVVMGVSTKAAEAEVRAAIDRLVYYAGWADKYQQIFSAVNPVASSHFNFSVPEPTGVVSAFAPEKPGLLGLVSTIAPIITGGNTCVVLASKKFGTSAITFAEALHTSDLPGGVVNILTGFRDELVSHFSSHMDVNAMVYCGDDAKEIVTIQENATSNLKRVRVYDDIDWNTDAGESPYFVMDTQETKTTWHPVGK
ncbi:aldehyde dehydrogenase family protein [bacterium]|nr:aldehyde dehydrogenase family protein [bacterium]